MARPTNSNQKKFLRRVATSMKSDKGLVNATQIYAEVYEVENMKAAQAAASRLLNKPESQRTLADYLAVDIPKHKRSKRLTDLTEATKDHVLQDGTTVVIRDNATSIRALELIMRCDGDLKDGSAINIDARSATYNVTADESAALASLADRLDKLEADDKSKRVVIDVESDKPSAGVDVDEAG